MGFSLGSLVDVGLTVAGGVAGSFIPGVGTMAGAAIGNAVGGAVAGGMASSDASSAVKGAANQATALQQQALQQQAQMNAPYTNLGQSAIPTLENLLGIPVTGMNPQPGQPGYVQGMAGAPQGAQPNAQTMQQTLESTPGYQFTKQQGQQAVQAQAGAMGLQGSGNVLAAFDKYTTGLADQTYQQQVQNMFQAVGIGQASATNQAANIGTTGQNLANIATNKGTDIANIDIANTKNAVGSLGSAMNNYTTLQALKGLPATPGGTPDTAGINPGTIDPSQYVGGLPGIGKYTGP